MGFLVNDLSLYGQYHDLVAFRDAIGLIMRMKQLALQFSEVFYCHRNLTGAQVTPTLSMPQAVQGLSVDERRALMQWLTKQGPFWEDTRLHGGNEYLECNKDIVTDTAVGEAAYCCFIGIGRNLVSFSPSSWEYSPITVTWTLDDGTNRNTGVLNHWEITEFEAVLRAAPPPITSWEQLGDICRTRFSELTFGNDSFEPLRGFPFIYGVARRILELLDTLHQIINSRDREGKFSVAGQQLYQNYFVGDMARFSDSSESEKHEFKDALTFQHPEKKEEYLFCTWHGKVKTPQIRIHFPWPPKDNEPLYVMYVGPKITKR